MSAIVVFDILSCQESNKEKKETLNHEQPSSYSCPLTGVLTRLKFSEFLSNERMMTDLVAKFD